MRVAINVSRSYTLTSAILKVDVVCEVAMTSTPNVLKIELRDLLNNHCFDNMCSYSFFIYPTGRISVCKKRFLSTGENSGKPCLVCKKINLYYLRWNNANLSQSEPHKTCIGYISHVCLKFMSMYLCFKVRAFLLSFP